jgi:LPS-assembly protein
VSRRIAAFFVAVWILGLLSAWAQEEQQEDERVRVKANTLTYEEQSDTITATGDVVVTRGDTTVTADSIGVNRTTNEVRARGNVVVKDLRGEIKADSLYLEMEDETGEISNGTVFLPRNQYTLTGKTLKKSYGQTYHIEDGAFTTCQCENFREADWSIGGSTVDVTLGGKGEVYNGVFRVRGIPVFYLPYGVVPIRTERQSGFLFPNFGFSSKRGFVWQQPFYWAINKSHDITVTTDLETAARVGIWGEYRYAPNEWTEGFLSASYFNEQIQGPATTSTSVDRWSVTGVHRQRLAEGLGVYGDAFYVSDDLFLREINHRALNLPSALESEDLRSRRFTDSRAGSVKTWRNSLLRSEAIYYQDLQQGDDFTFQVLPRLQFQGQRRFWQDRLETGIAVDGAHFYRNEGYAGQRLDIAPSVGLPFYLGNYLFGSVQVVGRETVYHLTSEDQGQPILPEAGRLQGDRTRETVQVNAEIGTRLSRIFNLRWGRLLQLQHVVEPQVAYMYTPFVDQEDLPLFDSLDRINKRNLFVYGVANRFLGKFASHTTASAESTTSTGTPTEVRELARVSIAHAYDPSRTLSKGEEHFSDVDIYARLAPFPFASFTFDSTYDVARGDVTTARLGAFMTDPRPLPPTTPLLQHLQRSTTIGVSYRTITDRLLKELNAYVVFRLSDQITTAYTGRYDFNDNSFIGNRYFLRYISSQQCWYIDIGLIDKVNPREFEFRLFFTFVGLSSSGRVAF